MKKTYSLIISIILLFTSCKGSDPTPPYVYESNPHYAWGYAQFYGAYYNENGNGNKNNVITLSLFSDSLSVNDNGELQGYGQYLFLEDVFIAANDTLLPVGTYTINSTGSTFTISSGINDTIDNEVYTLGATISYFEQNTSKSAMKLITAGTMVVSLSNDSIYTINCDFKTADNKELKGTYSDVLVHFDESIVTDNTIKGKITRKKKLKFQN
jgi:hypothetical protein